MNREHTRTSRSLFALPQVSTSLAAVCPAQSGCAIAGAPAAKAGPLADADVGLTQISGYMLKEANGKPSSSRCGNAARRLRFVKT